MVDATPPRWREPAVGTISAFPDAPIPDSGLPWFLERVAARWMLGAAAVLLFAAPLFVEVDEIGGVRNVHADLSNLTMSQLRPHLWIFALQVALVLIFAALAIAPYFRNLAQLREITAIARDISNRQVAIFNAAIDAMVVIDRHGRVESMNPAAERLFDRPAIALVGSSIDELFANGILYLDGFNERRGTPRAPAIVRQLEGIRGDGSRFEAEIAVSTVRLDDGIRSLLIVRDSTERNRAERIKDEFVSTVSHELRTPLTSIRGALSLLDHALGTSLAKKPARLLQIAKSNSERLSLLVDDILDIEKIGGGRLELRLEPVDVGDIVAQAVEQNCTYAADHGVRLAATSRTGPLTAVGDSGRLLQALSNLISNAAKFSPNGGVVQIAAERHGQMVRMSVSDQGPGIPIAFQSRLFERFAQAGNQPTQRSGTGLGLAITKGIVDLHHGKIGYETEPGRGTRFWIDLPCAEGRVG